MNKGVFGKQMEIVRNMVDDKLVKNNCEKILNCCHIQHLKDELFLMKILWLYIVINVESFWTNQLLMV